MASTVSHSPINTTHTWLHQSIFYLAVGFMFTAVVLRSLIIFQGSDLFAPVMLVLGLFLLLFAGNIRFTARIPWSTALLLALEGVLILLLLMTEQDFFAVLFAVLGMQAMQRYSPRVVTVVICLSAVLVFLSLVERIGPLQSLALSLIYSAVGAFMAAYIWSTRRAGVVQDQQQALLSELQEANQRLAFYARQQEQLAAGRERQRLARELHDSVTQTIFSMTLTTQAALLLLVQDPGRVPGQLDRLDELAESALAEMQMLISRLSFQAVSGGNFVSALQRHLEERRRMDNLQLILEMEGDGSLTPTEEAGLFRIAQEALNNIVKHARVSQAVIRLHLNGNPWMEIEDHGVGFDPRKTRRSGQVGLSGMSERAAEIGWAVMLDSMPGSGTRIRVEKRREESG